MQHYFIETKTTIFENVLYSCVWMELTIPTYIILVDFKYPSKF